MTRNLFWPFRTLPSKTVPTSSSRAISAMRTFSFLNLITEVLAITRRSCIRDTVVISSSVSPSAKYSSCGSGLRFMRGRMAIRLLSRFFTGLRSSGDNDGTVS